ncbi:MAG TPA: CaiB/BaiF CoA-transferase family protein, partial [Vitreimonas sp.]|nr:CaiB/BaiF CoA-transferase family protein [Vitreimonas sp.]
AERTGEGQHIDAALLDCQVAMLANLGASYLMSGDKPQRLGNHHAAIAPYEVLPTSDGHIILAIGNDHQFRAFCNVAGLALADDSRFANNDDRVQHRIELTAALSHAMSQRSTDAWIGALEAASVPCGPINTLDRVYADPQVQSRAVIESITRSDGVRLRLTSNPLRMSATPPVARNAPPALGEHTNEVLREVLNVAEGDLKTWRESGVIA